LFLPLIAQEMSPPQVPRPKTPGAKATSRPVKNLQPDFFDE
jgi:hypothetical protein